MNNDITLKTAGADALDEIEGLWRELTLLHVEKSLHFKQYFRDYTFQTRKAALTQRAEKGALLVVIAYCGGAKIGYCVASVVDGTGEIDSLYVKSEHRKSNVGDALMRAALSWIKQSDAKDIIVEVAVGNEEVFGFYAKYGFAPRRTFLQIVSE